MNMDHLLGADRRFSKANTLLIAFNLAALVIIWCLLGSGIASAADNVITVTPGTGLTLRSKDVGAGVQSPLQVPGDTSGNPLATAPGTPNASFALPVQGVTSGTPFPVTGTFWQATQPVSGTFWPYSLGQQLAASSVPVVLTAAQLTTLTPPTTVAVTQATAASLNATVVGTGTFATQSAITAAINSIADGAEVTIGTKADAAWSSGSGTLIAIEKANAAFLSTIATNTGAAIPTQAPTVSIGGVGIVDSGGTNVATVKAASTLPAASDKTLVVGLNPGTSTAGSPTGAIITVQGVSGGQPVPINGSLSANQSINEAQVNGVTTQTGAGAVGTGSQRVSVGQDTTTIAGSAPGTAGTPSTNVVSVQGIASGTPQPMSLNTTPTVANGNGVVPTPVPSGGLTTFFVQPTASDNHTNVKNGAGQVYWVLAENNSATVNYLRLYNAASGFNGCNSATNLITQIQIPASTSVGGINIPLGFGIPFSTGISFCVTSGYATNDTTNATASAISLTLGYN